MKRLIFVLPTVFMLLFGLGCTPAEKRETFSPETESFSMHELVTREYLISEYQLEDTEYLDEFIEEYHITRAYLETVYVDELYEMYVFNSQIEKYSYLYLLDTPELPRDGDLDEENIRRVLWFWNPGSSVEARLFDFPEKKLYYGDYNILNYIADAPVKDLSEEEIQWVVDVLSVCKVDSWEENYPCTVNNSTGWLFWMLAIEYNDGSIRQFSGSGSAGDNFPENYSTVKDFLMKFGE